MNIEEQVCSLELARRLRNLGLKRRSIFYWTYTNKMSEAVRLEDGLGWMIVPEDYFIGIPETTKYAAFTVAELGEMLSLNNEFPNIGKSEVGHWYVNFTRHHQDHFATEADGRASILVYLVERGWLSAVPTK